MIDLPVSVPDWVPVVGGSDCLRISDDECQRNSSNQQGADFAAGVLDTVTGGHQDGPLSVVGGAGKYNPDSGAFAAGRAAGVVPAMLNTTVTASIYAYGTSYDLMNRCMLGNASCSSSLLATSLVSVPLTGLAGLGGPVLGRVGVGIDIYLNSNPLDIERAASAMSC